METLSSTGKHSLGRTKEGAKLSRRQKRTHVFGRKATPQSFLTETIGDIRTIDLMDGILSITDIPAHGVANAANLISATQRWFQLHNLPAPEISGRDTFDVISKCHQLISAHLPEHHGLNIDYSYQSKELILIEYANCDFPYYTVFFFPISCLNKFKGKMRSLVLNFTAYLYGHAPFIWPEDSFDFSSLFEIYDDEEPDQETQEIIETYRNGDFKRLQDEVVSVDIGNLDKRILAQISSLPPEDARKYADLIDTIKEGVSLLGECNLGSFRYFPEDCSIPDFTMEAEDGIFTLERLFVMSYSLDESIDPMVEIAISSISEEANLIEMEEVMDYHAISSNDKKAFKPSTYPTRWAKWFNELLNNIEINEQTDSDSE